MKTKLIVVLTFFATFAIGDSVELLPEGEYSKSDCKGFHTHKLLEPYSVKIDSFNASKKWVDPKFKNKSTEKKIVLSYQGTIQFEETIEEIKVVREIKPTTQFGGALQVPIYRSQSQQPFYFLEKYRDTELANTIEKVELVVNKNGVLYDRHAPTASQFPGREEGEQAFELGTVRVREQPVSLCITFDLTKLENRKTSATKKSFAFQQFDGFRVRENQDE